MSDDNPIAPYHVLAWRLLWVGPYYAMALLFLIVVVITFGRDAGRSFCRDWLLARNMTDDFLNQILIGVGIVTCIAFGLAAVLYWALS